MAIEGRDNRIRYPYRKDGHWVLVHTPDVIATRLSDGKYRITIQFMGVEYHPAPSALEQYFLDQLWYQLSLELQHATPEQLEARNNAPQDHYNVD